MLTIRKRALLGGLICGVALCAVTPFADSYLKTTPLAGGHFPLAAFSLFFLSMICFALHAKLTRRPPLVTGIELLTAWGLMVVVSGIGFTGLVRTFFINITAPAHYADAGNGWAGSLLPLLPERLYPRDLAVVDALYHGLPGKADLSFFETVQHIPWSFWLPLMVQWSIFVLLVYVTLFCLANLFCQQWVENERINFPLLQMPKFLADAYDRGQLFVNFRDPFMLLGLCIPLFLHLLGGLNAYFPTVPSLPREILAGGYFPSTGVLSGFSKLKIFIIPAFIGFAFITTRQVSLSFWFFFLVAGLFTGFLQNSGLKIPDSALGTLYGPSISHAEETQAIGASLIFFLFMLWLARSYLAEVFRQCLHTAPHHQEVGWIPARYSLIGLFLGIAALCLWSMACGMGLTAAIMLYISFFAATLLLAKTVCQGGIPYCAMNVAPADGILTIFGSKPLGSVGLVLGMSLQKMLFVDVREALFPSLMHAGKITEPVQNRKPVALAIGASIVLAIAVSFFSMLYLGYRYGFQDLDMDWATRTTQTVYANSHRLLEVPQLANSSILSCIAAGAIIMLIMVLCYYYLPWWPFHPLGYLMAYSSSMRILWFSFFVGWLCNVICLRYGGAFLYRRIQLLFIGLIIGDFCMGAFWALISLFTGVSYLVLPS